MVVCGGSILLCHLVLNLIKSNAASSDKFKNQLKNIYNLRNYKKDKSIKIFMDIYGCKSGEVNWDYFK